MPEKSDYYVYVHITADSKTPFYIGKGRRNRCYTRRQRGTHWDRVVAKHGLIVEILHQGLTEAEAFQREAE